MATVTVTVRFFAAARERVGRAVDTVELTGAPTVQSVLDALVSRYPALASLLPHLRVAVEQDFAAASTPVQDGMELALIPPVAGGTPGVFRLQETALSLDEVVRAVSSTGHGGLVTFSGVVRDESHGQRIVQLEYEAFVPMAEKKLAEIGVEASAKWPGVSLAIIHRLGTLLPGELAVVIAASAPHRKEAFLACEYAIDRLKQDVPIWKKERGEDGDVWVGLGP